MKKSSVFFLGALVLAVFIAAFSLGNALAATGCFSDTNGHWAETYICWLKDNGISTGYQDGTFKPNNNITRAEMGVMLQRANAVPPQSGVILFSAGNSNWQPILSDANVKKSNYQVGTQLTKSSIGETFFTVQPDFTPVLYGKSFELLGVDFCYGADTNAYISDVEIDTHYASTGIGTFFTQYYSATNYVGEACRYFALPAPLLLTGEYSVLFYVGIEWVVANTPFYIGRTTFVLQPAGASALASSSFSEDTVILQESTGESPVPRP